MGGEACLKMPAEVLQGFYVLQVAPHEEAQVENIIRSTMPKTLCRHCFHPVRHIKKVHSECISCHENLLPGYVFAETDFPKEFFRQLMLIPRFTKMLGVSYDLPTKTFIFEELSPKEVEWLTKIMFTDEVGEVPLSTVRRDANGEIKIVSGPLLYLVGHVKKFDLHKRIAKIELSFRNEPALLYFGIEIVD